MARKNPTAHLDGADELNEALRRVGDRAGGILLKQAAEAGASIIAEEAKLLAPKKTGALAEGITVRLRRAQQGRAQFDIGISKATWYGKLVELGTSKSAAHPFLRPALNGKAEEAIDAVGDALRDALRDVMEMNAGAIIFARLSGATAAGTRVYPHILPQQPVYPAITYQQVSATRTHAMGETSPLVRVRMQVNLWATSYADVRTLAAATLANLGRYTGTVGAVRVLDVLLDNELETYESDTMTRRVVQDYTLLLTDN